MPDFDFDALAAKLRHGTAASDYPVQAATRLLAWHEYWLRRADFRDACVYEDKGAARIVWTSARDFAGSSPRCSSTELAVLRFAVALVRDEYGLNGFGHAHRQAAVDAFASALGVTSLSGEVRGA